MQITLLMYDIQIFLEHITIESETTAFVSERKKFRIVQFDKNMLTAQRRTIVQCAEGI